MQHLTYKNGKMWANVLAQLAPRGGQCREVARSSVQKEFAAVVLPYLSSCSPATREQTKLPTRDSHTQREIKIVNSPVCECVSSVCVHADGMSLPK